MICVGDLRGASITFERQDLDGENQGVVIDVGVRRNAEEGRFPLSCYLIFQLLLIYLAQGLVDGLLIQKLIDTFLWLSSHFAADRNIITSVRLTQQEIWLGKFRAAFQLWGTSNEIDGEFQAIRRLV